MQSRALSIAVFTALIAVTGCQADAGHSPGGSAASLCAACAPRAGGETSDFGNTCIAGCGDAGPPRPLTDDEARSYQLDRAQALVRDGLSLPIGWLPASRAAVDAPSRTGASTLNLRFETSEAPLVTETELCGPTIFFPADVALETSDGALQANLKGGLYSRGDGVWVATADVDLASARGSVDLQLAEAWRGLEGRGRQGALYLTLSSEGRALRGSIWATVWYESPPPGIDWSGLPTHSTPVVGYFPLNHCSLDDATPVAWDEPLPEVSGKTVGQLVQEARALFDEHCSRSWPATYRNGELASATLELSQPDEPAACRASDQDGVTLSWRASGSVRSADARLHASVQTAQVWIANEQIVGFGFNAGPAPADKPIGEGFCDLDPEDPQYLGSWSGSLRLPQQKGGHHCMYFSEFSGGCALP